jgi:signal peptidase I
MFGFLVSRERKMRASAANWLELAEKVWNFRRDALGANEAAELRRRQDELRRALRDRADAARLKLGVDSLEDVLRRTGGAVYPKSSLSENVEFFLVAAIMILGVRTYFVQPFKIPTNSMWPTYYGMTGENLPPGGPAPGPLRQAGRFLLFGAQRKEVTAPRSGEVSALFFGNGQMAYTLRSDRTWLVFPSESREYTFYVDGVPASVRVPKDFGDFDRLVLDTFFGGDPRAFAEYWNRLKETGGMEESWIKLSEGADSLNEVHRISLNRTVAAGEPVLRFDLMAGDQLFVDRFTYHFFRPTPGQGFVFRTADIPGIAAVYGDQYYIKRLVGVPGDVIEIRQPVLFRNHQPIRGAAAFDLNARRVFPYGGYLNKEAGDGASLLFRGEPVVVPPGRFLALGDNSGNSEDSRYWGFVPAADVVGRPLFIYYPFTRRWGPAK